MSLAATSYRGHTITAVRTMDGFSVITIEEHRMGGYDGGAQLPSALAEIDRCSSYGRAFCRATGRCGDCKGTGHIAESTCDPCAGTGWINVAALYAERYGEVATL